jgi:hypothetical protein
MTRRKKKVKRNVSADIVIPSRQVTVLRPIVCCLMSTHGFLTEPTSLGSRMTTPDGGQLGLLQVAEDSVNVLCCITIHPADIRTLANSPTKYIITQLQIEVPETALT